MEAFYQIETGFFTAVRGVGYIFRVVCRFLPTNTVSASFDFFVSGYSDARNVFLAKNKSGYVRSNLIFDLTSPSYDLAKK